MTACSSSCLLREKPGFKCGHFAPALGRGPSMNSKFLPQVHLHGHPRPSHADQGSARDPRGPCQLDLQVLLSAVSSGAMKNTKGSALGSREAVLPRLRRLGGMCSVLRPLTEQSIIASIPCKLLPHSVGWPGIHQGALSTANAINNTA